MSDDLSKETLYESVKTLVELEDKPHLLLNQHKLFTLFTIAFQYMLFCSTKKSGAYIIRIEDSVLAEKLLKKSKDQLTRNFLRTLILPRKMKYGNSWFYIDFFHIGSWNLTNDIPKDKVRGAIIVKNSSTKPMNEIGTVDNEIDPAMENLPPNYFLTSLQSFVPKTITIAFDEKIEGLHTVSFPFITKEREKSISGVTLSRGLDWDNLD